MTVLLSHSSAFNCNAYASWSPCRGPVGHCWLQHNRCAMRCYGTNQHSKQTNKHTFWLLTQCLLHVQVPCMHYQAGAPPATAAAAMPQLTEGCSSTLVLHKQHYTHPCPRLGWLLCRRSPWQQPACHSSHSSSSQHRHLGACRSAAHALCRHPNSRKTFSNPLHCSSS